MINLLSNEWKKNEPLLPAPLPALKMFWMLDWTFKEVIRSYCEILSDLIISLNSSALWEVIFSLIFIIFF